MKEAIDLRSCKLEGEIKLIFNVIGIFSQPFNLLTTLFIDLGLYISEPFRSLNHINDRFSYVSHFSCVVYAFTI